MLAPNLVRVKIQKAVGLNLTSKKKLKCKVYGSNKTIYTQLVQSSDNQVTWDSELNIKMDSKQNEVKIVISDERNNHYGQVCINNNEIVGRPPGTTSNLLMDLDLEPTPKERNVHGRLFLWIWASSLKDPDLDGRRSSGISSLSKFESGSTSTINKLKDELKDKKNKIKKFGTSFGKSDHDLSKPFKKDSISRNSSIRESKDNLHLSPGYQNMNISSDNLSFIGNPAHVENNEFHLPVPEIKVNKVELDNIQETERDENRLSPQASPKLKRSNGSNVSQNPLRRPKIIDLDPKEGPADYETEVKLKFEDLQPEDLNNGYFLIGNKKCENWSLDMNDESIVKVKVPVSARGNISWNCTVEVDTVNFGILKCPHEFHYKKIEDSGDSLRPLTNRPSVKIIREPDSRLKYESSRKSSFGQKPFSTAKSISDESDSGLPDTTTEEPKNSLAKRYWSEETIDEKNDQYEHESKRELEKSLSQVSNELDQILSPKNTGETESKLKPNESYNGKPRYNIFDEFEENLTDETKKVSIANSNPISLLANTPVLSDRRKNFPILIEKNQNNSKYSANEKKISKDSFISTYDSVKPMNKPVNEVIPTKVETSFNYNPEPYYNDAKKGDSETILELEEKIYDLTMENESLRKKVGELNSDVDRISLDLCKLRFRILENGPIELLEKQCSLETQGNGVEILQMYSNKLKYFRD